MHSEIWNLFQTYDDALKKQFLCSQGAFSVKFMPEVRQKLFGCTPTVKIGVHLRCKHQKNRALKFALYLRQYAKEHSIGYIYAVTLKGKVTPHRDLRA